MRGWTPGSDTTKTRGPAAQGRSPVETPGNPGTVADQLGGRVAPRRAPDFPREDASPVGPGRDARAGGTPLRSDRTSLRRPARRYPPPAVAGRVAPPPVLLLVRA